MWAKFKFSPGCYLSFRLALSESRAPRTPRSLCYTTLIGSSSEVLADRLLLLLFDSFCPRVSRSVWLMARTEQIPFVFTYAEVTSRRNLYYFACVLSTWAPLFVDLTEVAQELHGDLLAKIFTHRWSISAGRWNRRRPEPRERVDTLIWRNRLCVCDKRTSIWVIYLRSSTGSICDSVRYH
jgi:hypothetical protein